MADDEAKKEPMAPASDGGPFLERVDLAGRVGLVIGVANEHSLAWSAAQHFRNAGAELAPTYFNEKAKPYVEPLARQVGAKDFLPCNVTVPGQLEAVFEAIQREWGRPRTRRMR